MFKPLLVTGLPGVPGWALFRWFAKNWPSGVVGVAPQGSAAMLRHPLYPASGAQLVQIDAEDTARWIELLRTPDKWAGVLDASGNCALRACECDPALSRLLNITLGTMIAQISAELGLRLVRISSDLVFGGGAGVGGHKESHPTDPVTVYGKDMAKAEEAILRYHDSACLLRISLPMDYSPGGMAGAMDWIEYRFRPHRPATLYFDEVRSSIYGDDLCRVVEYVLQNPAEDFAGIWHCGGPRETSLYQVGQLVNAVGGYAPELLKGCPRHEAGPMPPRAGHVGMDSSALTAKIPAGTIRPWPVDDLLVPAQKDWHYTVDRQLWGGGNKILELLVRGSSILGLP